MKCPKCLNENPKYFYKGSKGYYCRRCISYKKILNQEVKEFYYTDKKNIDADYTLRFELTKAQKEISEKCSELSFEMNILIWAACGAGKTEIVMESIKKHLLAHHKVGYAIPRRQVVIEVGERLKKAFSNLKVVYVCEGYTNELDGDLIVCTTYQLYRYTNKFDFLVLDEPDAFPYKGNPVLQGIAKASCKGHMVALSATPDDNLKQFKTLTLFKRPHGHPLSVPVIKYCPPKLLDFLLVSVLKDKDHVLVFVPSIRKANRLKEFLKCPSFTSQTEDKDSLCERFRQREFKYLVCTTVLERGVTFSNVDVVVYQANHQVFDKASLVQIAGRVGRDPKYPKGEITFLCTKKQKEVIECINDIKMMNA